MGDLLQVSPNLFCTTRLTVAELLDDVLADTTFEGELAPRLDVGFALLLLPFQKFHSLKFLKGRSSYVCSQ